MGTLRLFAETQTQIDVFSDQIIESVKQGEASPLEVLKFFKAFERVAERVKKEIHENAMNEADKYSEKSFMIHGVKFEKAELGTKYDYSACGDPVWNELTEQSEALSKRIKKREEWLKTMGGHENIVTGDGEVVTIYPPIKKSTSGLKITIQ